MPKMPPLLKSEKPKPPLIWHGGKCYLAERIVELMPPRTDWCHYVEPYFGGGAVLLANDPAGISETVNDLNGDLSNFWRVLQCEVQFAKFQRVLQAVPFSEAEWTTAEGRAPIRLENGDCDWRLAVSFFVKCRQSLAGRMDQFSPLSRTRTRRGMNEQASAWLTAIEGLPAVHARLKRVAILGPRPAVDVIKQEDGPKTLFYLDPPYLPDTRTSPDVYRHEMSERDHRTLLFTIKHCQGRVMLSGYRNQLYDSALDGWNRHEFELPNNAAGGKTKRRMTEILWSSF